MRETTNYVYVIFGDGEMRWLEIFYSIGTLLKKIDPATARIVVFTDHPKKFQKMPVNCHDISGEMAAMRGFADFEYRMKICCILKCAETFPGNVFYLDSDTIVTGNIVDIAAQLKKGRAIMWRRERLASRMAGFEKFEMQLPNGFIYRYGPDACMFNAGVVALHHENAKATLQTALALCDGFKRHDRSNRLCEQFANSEAMRISGLKILEADKVVAHYYRASFRTYMHERLPGFNARLKTEPWDFDRPIPCSYARVQWAKLRRKFPR